MYPCVPRGGLRTAFEQSGPRTWAFSRADVGTSFMLPRQYDLHKSPGSGQKFNVQFLKVDPMGCGPFSTLHSR